MRLLKILSPSELRKYRKSVGLTQTQMASVMGLSVKSYRLIGGYERGERDLSVLAWKNLDKWRKNNE